MYDTLNVAIAVIDFEFKCLTFRFLLMFVDFSDKNKSFYLAVASDENPFWLKVCYWYCLLVNRLDIDEYITRKYVVLYCILI